MNKYLSETRKRGQNLLIVEGNHKKNELFWLIFKCFPEFHIEMEDVWIYGTNIYMLYEDIIKEYDADWAVRDEDVDLPYVISKKQNMEKIRYKEDFTNIIMVFDYERHDPGFSEQKILEMQKFFADAANMGKLYINYPMIESYQHLKSIPDEEYAERRVSVSLQPGNRYKRLVSEETVIGKTIGFSHKLDNLMKNHFGVNDTQIRENCCNHILNLFSENNMDNILCNILKGVMDETRMRTAMYQLRDWIKQIGYAQAGKTYWQYMRSLFQQIIYHNICKANKIQNDIYQINREEYKNCFEDLDLTLVLEKQNNASKDDTLGYIWVLNTCVLFVAEYNFSLVTEI